MNPINNKYIQRFSGIVLVIIALTLSCTKSARSFSFPNTASINISSASHVYDSMQKTRRVYLSGFDTTNSNLRMSFISNGGYGSNEIPANGQVEATRLDRPMNFYDFYSGQQRLRFADTAGTIVADTMLSFSPGSYTGVYIADDTTRVNPYARSGLFRIFSFAEQRVSTPGKLRLRYIDLVPDIDTLNGYIYSAAGQKFVGNATPRRLLYGTASDYYDLDTTGLVVSGQILLRMFRRQDTANYKSQVAIPAIPGRSYTIVVSGNAGYWLCRYSIRKPDGTTAYRYVNYPPNIKGIIRTIN